MEEPKQDFTRENFNRFAKQNYVHFLMAVVLD